MDITLMKRNVKIFCLIVIACNLTLLGFARTKHAAASPEWLGTWATSQQIPEPHNSLDPNDLQDAALRQIIHLSVGGNMLRVHLSNAFGIAPLHLTSVHIAKPLSTSSAKIDPATDKALTFAGSGDVTIPAGAQYISDPIEYPVAALSNLAITIHMETPPLQQTGHPGSRSTSYLAHGDLVSAVDLPGAKTMEHWYWISGVDVNAPARAAAVVVLGDSITDGHATTTNGNDRWTDVLAERMQASPSTRMISVLNQGLGGNRLLLDGLGPNAVSRVDRDILAQPGVKYVIVLEGVNDLGVAGGRRNAPQSVHDALVHQMIGAYQQIVLRAHEHGIKVFGATILPYGGSFYDHPGEQADWQAVNDWIRAPGHFDAVIDFAKTMADPAHPNALLPAYDSGDHLHPGPVGYRAMGGAVPLSLFEK
jgi:lysophospholipase L1-like esterase